MRLRSRSMLLVGFLLFTIRASFVISSQSPGIKGKNATAGDSASIASITILDPDTNQPTKEVVVNVGNTVKPTLLVLDTNGAQRTDFVLTYTSLDTEVATAESSGTIFGVKEGFSTLAISSGGVVATGTITVVAVDSGSGGFDITGIVQDQARRLYLASSGDHTILQALNLKSTPTLYAGMTGISGLRNDLRFSSLFRNPSFLAFNQATGSLYVGDSANHVIRRVQPGPDGQVDTIAGSGIAGALDGTGDSASFNYPQGVALDNRGNLWVVDTGNHTIRRINLSTRAVETIAGKAGISGSADGTGEEARFNFPVGIALETEPLAKQLDRATKGDPPPPVTMIVSDTGNGFIRRVGESKKVETILSAEPTAPDAKREPQTIPSAALKFNSPKGVAVDPSGNIYVTEPNSARIRTILRNGTLVSATQAKTFTAPSGIDVSQSGKIVVTDSGSLAREIGFGAPVITSLTPNQVSIQGGSKITVQGKNFAPETQLIVAGVVVSNYQVTNTNTITFTSPALPSGRTTITAQNRGGLAQTSLLVDAVSLSSLPAGYITTVAGGSTFLGDGGLALSAAFTLPQSAAFDSAGNLYIADGFNHRIRKLDARTATITTVVGNGQSDFSGDNGPAIAAALKRPQSVCFDSAGNLYISDSWNHRIRKVDVRTGTITTVAGVGKRDFSGDNGPATAAALNVPWGVAVDSTGNLYLSDTDNQRVRKVDPRTGIITTIAGGGSSLGDNGPATAAALNDPIGLAIDSSGDLYIAEASNNRIRKVAIRTGIITTVAGGGSLLGDGGPATSAALSVPIGLAFDSSGNFFIADLLNNRIRKVDTRTGIITTVAGSGQPGFSGDFGLATAAALRRPQALAFDSSGNFHIVDSSNNRIRKVDAQTGIISTSAGKDPAVFSGDNGPATAAILLYPEDLAFDSAGNYFIVDSYNARIRKVEFQTGVIKTVAGTGDRGFSGDNGPATAAVLLIPDGMAFDSSENFYIADTGNLRIRRVDSGTRIITTIAGTGERGFSGDNNAATLARLSLRGPQTSLGMTGLAFDPSGSLYIADTENNRIRRVEAKTAIITTIAGGGSSLGDNGPATSAALNFPQGLAFDSSGNLYIADKENNRIRRVDARTGTITTVAGTGELGFSGDNGPATAAALRRPQGIAFDSSNNLYIADTNNVKIRRVDAHTGIITTVAGDGRGTFSGDNGPAIKASFLNPSALRIDSAGNLLVVDTHNHRIRAIRGAPGSASIPTLDITMSKAVYAIGDTITATEFRVRNPGSNPVPIKLRVWLKVPTVGEVNLIDIGADGSFTLPANLDANIAPASLFAITSSFPPRGNWELNSRLENPTTGARIYEDLNPFVIQ